MSRFACAERGTFAFVLEAVAMEFEESEFLVEDTRRYIVLVIYDIVENKRRSKMVK